MLDQTQSHYKEDKMTKKLHVSYDDMHQLLNSMFRSMAKDKYKPDLIVGITRGGLIPAVHVSHYFDVPMTTIQYSLRDHTSISDNLIPYSILRAMSDKKQVLFVDDICDEGHTLFNIYEDIDKHISLHSLDKSTTKSAVLHHNLGATLFTPDYCGMEINKVEDPVWIIYPYEY